MRQEGEAEREREREPNTLLGGHDFGSLVVEVSGLLIDVWEDSVASEMRI